MTKHKDDRFSTSLPLEFCIESAIVNHASFLKVFSALNQYFVDFAPISFPP